MGVYEDITRKIVVAIESGQATGDGWKMPWHNASGRPVNVSSGRAYAGVNTVNLWIEAQEKGYSSPLWGTLRQWNEAGAKVKKGEKASIVVFWKGIPKRDADENEDNGRRFVLKTSYAFSADQVDGYKKNAPVAVFEPCAVEKLVFAAGVDVRLCGGRAFYHTTLDYVQLPAMSDFHSVSGFQSTLLHEAAHWTGHKSRLDRQFGKRFGDAAYAFEELVAEISAAFLCADLGVSNHPRNDHAEYVASWLKVLKSDPRAIFTAASQATKAAEYLLSFSTRKKEEVA